MSKQSSPVCDSFIKNLWCTVIDWKCEEQEVGWQAAKTLRSEVEIQSCTEVLMASVYGAGPPLICHTSPAGV